MAFSGILGRRQSEEAALALYSAAVHQARRTEFYLALGVPDSVDGRFDLVTLHVFLILHRLGEAGRETRGLGQALFDLMFADMDGNLREMGVSDLGVGKRVKAMVKAFYGRIAAYEPELAGGEGLKTALSRNLYRGAAVADATLSAMAAYVVREAAALAAQDAADLQEGRVSFGDPIAP